MQKISRKLSFPKTNSIVARDLRPPDAPLKIITGDSKDL